MLLALSIRERFFAENIADFYNKEQGKRYSRSYE
jgi:hypothetical protein